mgnify:CR=1 FL=1
MRQTVSLVPILLGISHPTVPHEVVAPDPELVELGNVANEPLHNIMMQPLLLGEGADPVADGTAGAHLVPVVPAFLLVTGPPEDTWV